MSVLDRTMTKGDAVATTVAGVLGCVVGIPLYFVALLVGSALKLALLGWRKGWAL